MQQQPSTNPLAKNTPLIPVSSFYRLRDMRASLPVLPAVGLERAGSEAGRGAENEGQYVAAISVNAQSNQKRLKLESGKQ